MPHRSIYGSLGSKKEISRTSTLAKRASRVVAYSMPFHPINLILNQEREKNSLHTLLPDIWHDGRKLKRCTAPPPRIALICPFRC